MLKFPRTIDEIDPLPPLNWGTDFCSPTYPHPLTRRHIKEWNASIEKENGDDWAPIPSRPKWYRNGKGQLIYSPYPLPPLPEVPQAGPRTPKVGDRIRKAGWDTFYTVGQVFAHALTLQCYASPMELVACYYDLRDSAGKLIEWEYENA